MTPSLAVQLIQLVTVLLWLVASYFVSRRITTQGQRINELAERVKKIETGVTKLRVGVEFVPVTRDAEDDLPRKQDA